LTWNQRIPAADIDVSWQSWLADALKEAQPRDQDAFAIALERRRAKLPPALWERRIRSYGFGIFSKEGAPFND
jgi:hypothetical protein